MFYFFFIKGVVAKNLDGLPRILGVTGIRMSATFRLLLIFKSLNDFCNSFMSFFESSTTSCILQFFVKLSLSCCNKKYFFSNSVPHDVLIICEKLFNSGLIFLSFLGTVKYFLFFDTFFTTVGFLYIICRNIIKCPVIIFNVIFGPSRCAQFNIIQWQIHFLSCTKYMMTRQ